MSQNNPTGGSGESTSGKGTNSPRATGGAGTGDTDAGTTRAAGAGSGTSAGSSSSTGSGQSLTPTTGTTGGSSGTGAGTATGLAAQAKEYGQKVADAASTAKDYVSDKMTPVVDKIKDLQNTDYKEVANQAKDYARQNPGQAILISAAAGLVLGLLIRGSRR
ncbi:MAG: hypothetical protein H0X14_07965 [Acidobacteria bacterium]|nr:hypothetical protein [Acidobacteriota bacterium]